MNNQTSRPGLEGGRRQSRFGLAWFNLLGLLVCFFVLRLVLFLHFKPQPPVGWLDIFKGFIFGLHVDLFVATILTAPLVIWLSIVPDRWFGAVWHRIVLRSVLLLFWVIQIFLLFAEFYFFEEF